MHYLDIIILIIIAASAVEGGIHGFVFEIFSLAGLLVGLLLAVKYFSLLASYLQFLSLSGWILNVISFLVILILVSALFRLVGRLLKKGLSKIFMGWLDHTMGVLFGIARGVVIVLLITLILLLTPLQAVLLTEAPKTRFLQPSLQVVEPYYNLLIQEHKPSLNSV
jgi:membrane protein required for colicin V production